MRWLLGLCPQIILGTQQSLVLSRRFREEPTSDSDMLMLTPSEYLELRLRLDDALAKAGSGDLLARKLPPCKSSCGLDKNHDCFWSLLD